jgi:hypothetical protein
MKVRRKYGWLPGASGTLKRSSGCSHGHHCIEKRLCHSKFRSRDVR